MSQGQTLPEFRFDDPESTELTNADGTRTKLAAYGKACINCARSKTRCGAHTLGKCERCHRLQKECVPAPEIRKKRAAKKPNLSKTAALEQKLDGIVQMLQESKSTPPLTSHSQDQPLGVDTLRAPYNPSIGPPTPASSSTSVSTPPHHLGYSCGIDGHSIAVPVSYPPETPAELEEILDTYQTKLVPFFPVALIQPGTTIQHIKRERPFLWLVIRATCSRSQARQYALGLEIRQRLAHAIMIDAEKSLDLLFGIVVFAAWSHYHICTKPISSSLVQFGMAIAGDLCLTKPIPKEIFGVMRDFNAQGCPRPPKLVSAVRTMEERRAMVGLLYVSLVTTFYFQRIDAMRFTPYMDECLKVLEDSEDAPTDVLLVHLVRVQLLCNSIILVFPSHGPDAMHEFHVNAAKMQLKELEQAVPIELKSNDVLQLHLLHAKITIHETRLNSSCLSSNDPIVQMQRAEDLWTCFTATKTWLETFFDVGKFPLQRYPHISTAIFGNLAHCLITMFRLHTFESPGIPWDLKQVRQEMDIREVVKEWIDRWKSVPHAAGLIVDSQEESPWSYTRKRLITIAKWWELRMAADAEREGLSNPESREGPGLDVPLPDFDFGAMDVEFLDDMWGSDVFGGSGEFFGGYTL
ncbi:hypothetical protein EJ08DRAFT_700324 [Tothia fuscella]|uniref:Zn(2)-C6 fungal-type domain-containing protein n=1 Tax=Tothia fuscella TaxID=1048955 RepID=A0A9P4TVZ2_9PEZI|nr:hypothetical protein EJ08DRAFT_700324 [Tothia fuscella]